MTKKDRNIISNGISAVIILISLFLYVAVFKSNNMLIFFGIILLAPIIKSIVFGLLPNKKDKKVNTPKRKSHSANTNRLRTDREILMSKLDEISWREFERLCFLYYKSKGYKPRETSEGADGGVDLIIYSRHHQTDIAVQIKHYYTSGNRITVKEIREINSAKRNHKCSLSDFITTSTFTKDALKEADKYNIVCRDIHWVENNIIKWKNSEVKKNALISS